MYMSDEDDPETDSEAIKIEREAKRNNEDPIEKLREYYKSRYNINGDLERILEKYSH